ncbi:hypothetical protein KP509_29G021500 [Ceratopteris richardii]|uniref:Haloacid dehalogenase-like hydrolase domain-containing protein Sgpp n=1 Tax=Ceratopteris richardii TaxID=49495 RepID=A0A8T2R588_CERRI|nr:hypothetical protein KP509_29G021500 [Ceratopteris richardii]
MEDPVSITLYPEQQNPCALNPSFASFNCKEAPRKNPFPEVRDLKAVLFDVDGTLCDSDALHYISFRDTLQEMGFQGGVPITEEFFMKNISGKTNYHIGLTLFPDWEQERRDKFIADKEVRFFSILPQLLKPVNGLYALCNWVKKQGLRRAAVTNSPRANAELMISLIGLSDFFDEIIIGDECERPKPFPDPYQRALKHFGIEPHQAFVLEDSPTGIRAAVSAGISTVGVATRNAEQTLNQAGATIVVKDFHDAKLWRALDTNRDKYSNATKQDFQAAYEVN